MTQSGQDYLHWVRKAATIADNKKGLNTLIIDVGDILAVTDYFLITSAPNSRQVNAICDAIEEGLKEAGGPVPVRVEGKEEREWVLMDYGAFVAHVFLAETRNFYQLEKLWSDRPFVSWASAASGAGGFAPEE